MSDERERMKDARIEEVHQWLKEEECWCQGIESRCMPCETKALVAQLRADLKEVTNEAVALRMQYESALDMVLQETGEKLNALKKLRFAESAYEDHITIKQDLAAANEKLRVADDALSSARATLSAEYGTDDPDDAPEDLCKGQDTYAKILTALSRLRENAEGGGK